MAMYCYKCSTCGATARFLADPATKQGLVPCLASCGGAMERDQRGPSSRVTEVIDTGGMPRSLERLADAERIYKERAKSGK